MFEQSFNRHQKFDSQNFLSQVKLNSEENLGKTYDDSYLFLGKKLVKQEKDMKLSMLFCEKLRNRPTLNKKLTLK